MTWHGRLFVQYCLLIYIKYIEHFYLFTGSFPVLITMAKVYLKVSKCLYITITSCLSWLDTWHRSYENILDMDIFKSRLFHCSIRDLSLLILYTWYLFWQEEEPLESEGTISSTSAGQCSLVCTVCRTFYAKCQVCEYHQTYLKRMMNISSKLFNKYKTGVLRIHLGYRVNAFISSSEGFEKVLSRYKQITKVKRTQFLIFGWQMTNERYDCRVRTTSSWCRGLGQGFSPARAPSGTTGGNSSLPPFTSGEKFNRKSPNL